ncbi:MAG: helix-turn-helix domain-containing protein [Nanoarchaeota archaeon]
MDTSVLEEIGLNKGEAKVYLALLELGESKVGPIIDKSGLVSSVVHVNINKLVENGLASYIKKGKIKFYKAVSPKQILDFIKEKEKKLLEIIPFLEEKQKKSEGKEEAEIFEGIKGITSMLNLIIENSKKGEEFFLFATDMEEKQKEIQEFWEKYDLKRKEKRLIVKGIAPKKLRHLFAKREVLKMKYTNSPLLSSITIFQDKVATISFGEKPVGYLIKSKQVSEMYKNYFRKMWKSIK